MIAFSAPLSIHLPLRVASVTSPHIRSDRALQLPTRILPNALPKKIQQLRTQCVKCVVAPSASSLINKTVLNTSLTAVSKLLVTLALGVAAAYRGVLDPATLSVRSTIQFPQNL